MGATYVTDEPDIATVGQEQWRSWFTALPDDQKIAWATAYKGSPVTHKAAALGIARTYAESAGFEAKDVFAPYAYHEMALRSEEADRRAMMLVGAGAVGLVVLIMMRRKKRR